MTSRNLPNTKQGSEIFVETRVIKIRSQESHILSIVLNLALGKKVTLDLS